MITDPAVPAKSIVRLCPVLSSAITYEREGPDGKRVRVHELARSPCIRGECEMFDIGTFSCCLKRPAPACPAVTGPVFSPCTPAASVGEDDGRS